MKLEQSRVRPVPEARLQWSKGDSIGRQHCQSCLTQNRLKILNFSLKLWCKKPPSPEVEDDYVSCLEKGKIKKKGAREEEGKGEILQSKH